MPSGAVEILTVGHSTHAIERFLELLRDAGVRAVADVRRYPASRRNPQFSAGALAEDLAEAEIAYEPFAVELGGRRGAGRPVAGGDAPDNSAWRNASFRAYAHHMASAEFNRGLERLEALGRERRTAIMCAEAHPSRSHRQLIADALLARGWRVLDLLGDGRLGKHPLSRHAVVTAGAVSYPGRPTLGA